MQLCPGLRSERLLRMAHDVEDHLHALQVEDDGGDEVVQTALAGEVFLLLTIASSGGTVNNFIIRKNCTKFLTPVNWHIYIFSIAVKV